MARTANKAMLEALAAMGQIPQGYTGSLKALEPQGYTKTSIVNRVGPPREEPRATSVWFNCTLAESRKANYTYHTSRDGKYWKFNTSRGCGVGATPAEAKAKYEANYCRPHKVG